MNKYKNRPVPAKAKRVHELLKLAMEYGENSLTINWYEGWGVAADYILDTYPNVYLQPMLIDNKRQYTFYW